MYRLNRNIHMMTTENKGPLTAPLEINIKPSLRLGVMLGAIHGGALLLLWIAPMDISYSLVGLFSLLIAGSALYTLQNSVLKLAEKRLVLRGDIIVLEDGTEAEVLPDTFVQAWMIILVLKVSRWKRRYVVIMSDALDADTFRRLSVRLRYRLDEE